MGHSNLIELLLDRQTDINARTEDRMTALMIVAKSDHTMNTNDLLKGLMDSVKLVQSAQWMYVYESLVRLLISRGAGTKARTLSGKIALAIVAENSCDQSVRVLLNAGAADSTDTKLDSVEVEKALDSAHQDLLQRDKLLSHRRRCRCIIKLLEQVLRGGNLVSGNDDEAAEE